MTDVQSIFSSISFSDGNIKSVHFEEETARLIFNDWTEKKIEFVFEGVIFLKAFMLGDVVEAELHTSSPEIEEAKEFLEGIAENPADYADLFHLKLIGDGPLLQIIFKRMKVFTNR